MSRSKQHERLKSIESGRKERLTPKGRFDVSTKIKDVEIERSGSPQRIKHAVSKLKDTTKPQKVLRVPQYDMSKASKIAKEMNAKITITNLGKTKRRSTK